LLRVTIQDVPDSKDYSNAFKVTKHDISFGLLGRSLETNTTLACHSKDEKENWLSKLKYAFFYY
jgi:hypothetical protein